MVVFYVKIIARTGFFTRINRLFQGGGHQGVVGEEKIISGDVTLYKYGISSIQYRLSVSCIQYIVSSILY